MITAIIQIGNSDDKLTQFEWSTFVEELQNIILGSNYPIHFQGYSRSDAPWQNACWVIEMPPGLAVIRLKEDLATLATSFRQDSIAFTSGATEFIKNRYANG